MHGGGLLVSTKELYCEVGVVLQGRIVNLSSCEQIESCWIQSIESKDNIRTLFMIIRKPSNGKPQKNNGLFLVARPLRGGGVRACPLKKLRYGFKK